MRKKSRRSRREQKRKMNDNRYDLPHGTIHWQEGEEMHFLIPGIPSSAEEIAELTRMYQDNIRNSDVFEMWVNEFGLANAEELVQECHYKVRR
jgi:hypothetical protein